MTRSCRRLSGRRRFTAPPPRRGSARRARGSRGTRRSSRRPARAARPVPGAPAARPADGIRQAADQRPAAALALRRPAPPASSCAAMCGPRRAEADHPATRAAHARAQRGEVAALVVAAEQQDDAAGEAVDRFLDRADVGRLRVVVPAHAAALAHEREAVRQAARSRRMPARIGVGRRAPGGRRGDRRRACSRGCARPRSGLSASA